MITIVVTICQMITVPVCHDVPIQQVENRMACAMSQPIIAEWKGKSIYREDKWVIMKYDCVPGTYVPKNEI